MDRRVRAVLERELRGVADERNEARSADVARETFERTGASVMGKRMFDLGEQAWPAEAPFHTPVLVVTHEKRDPRERPGGTTLEQVRAEPTRRVAHLTYAVRER